MAKFAIDLLPLEFKQENFKKAKFYKIQSTGVAAILAVVFFASLTVALRVLQSQQIKQINSSLTQTESKISDLQTTESSLSILKERLTTINKYLGISSEQVQMYNLIQRIIPSSISVASMAVSGGGDILISATTQDVLAIDQVINDLTDQEKNQNKIASVSMDNLNKGRDGIFRLSLTIKPKQK